MITPLHAGVTKIDIHISNTLFWEDREGGVKKEWRGGGRKGGVRGDQFARRQGNLTADCIH